MEEGRIIITGGSGFLGVSVARLILERNPLARVVLIDVLDTPRRRALGGDAEFIEADISDAPTCERVISGDVGTIYHLASLVSGGAERDFVLGMKSNIFATINLLEACRERSNRPRFVFASSIATFGGLRMPSVIDDLTHQHPQSSYGVAKVVGEQLLNDYSRKGFLDGRGVRLAAVVVRDVPNSAASSYASSIIREPMLGNDYVCPVPADTRLPIIDVKRCVRFFVALGELEEGVLGDYRTINGQSIAPSAAEMAESVRTCGVKGLGKISFRTDPDVERIVSTWPRELRSDRADSIFGPAEGLNLGSIVAEYAREMTG